MRGDLRLDAGEGPEPLVRVTVRVLGRGDPLQVGAVVEGRDLGVLAHLGEQAEAEEPAREKESKKRNNFCLRRELLFFMYIKKVLIGHFKHSEEAFLVNNAFQRFQKRLRLRHEKISRHC